MLDRILAGWSRAETFLIGVLLVVSLLVFMTGTALRYFAPGSAVDWTDEVSIYCIVWATVLAGGALVQERRHISAEVVVNLLPERIRTVVAFLILILTLLFCTAMAWYGWEAVQFAVMLDERSASSLRTPMGYALFLALPVGMALMVMRILLLMLNGMRSLSGENDELARIDLGTTGSEAVR